MPHPPPSVSLQGQTEVLHYAFDDEDMAIFNFSGAELQSQSPSKNKGKEAFTRYTGEGHIYTDMDDEDDYHVPTKPTAVPKPTENTVERPPDDWKHDPDYVQKALDTFELPQFESSGAATIALQKELKLTLKEQKNAKSLKELGWYLPMELFGDNLYQWTVEMHSFDDDLPIAKDMKKQ